MREDVRSCGKLLDLPAFGALITRILGEQRLTQETLALDVFGDSTRKGDISRIENARITPQEATIQRLCAALNISNAELDPIRMSNA
ncbi:MAG: helix-turn-helix domain-containing protein [Paracoccaceae bacterium]|nr:helix-turn-helix domain-containing protein [Paracoccaceae bacterium]